MALFGYGVLISENGVSAPGAQRMLFVRFIRRAGRDNGVDAIKGFGIRSVDGRDNGEIVLELLKVEGGGGLGFVKGVRETRVEGTEGEFSYDV